MQTVGNALTILGILVTLWGYFGQHSVVSLADREPGLVKRWHKGRAWVLRKLGRMQTVSSSMSATLPSLTVATIGMTWSPIQPRDDIGVRADKLERNLDALRTNLQQTRDLDEQRFRKVTEGLTERVNTLDQTVATRHEVSHRATTRAMRLEFRGLLITLVGAGLAIVG